MNTNIKALVNRVKSRGQVGVIRALQHDFREDGRSECGANGNEDYWQRSIYPHHGQMSIYPHHVLFKGQQDREMFTHQNHLNV